jgi:hypothetical protein
MAPTAKMLTKLPAPFGSKEFRHTCRHLLRRSGYVPLLEFLQNSVAVFGIPLALLWRAAKETVHGNFSL